MVPHRRVDETDNERTLLQIAARSSSFMIERIFTILLFVFVVFSHPLASHDCSPCQRTTAAG